MIHQSVLLQVAVFSAGVACLKADTVILKNGDRISGSVLRQQADTLEFETSYAGTLSITWSEVADLQLDEPVEVLLEDESVVTVSRIRNGRISGASLATTSKSGPSGEGQPVDIIKPTPEDKGQRGRFSGKFNVGLKLEDGNNNTDQLDADFELRYRLGDHRLRGTGQLGYETNQNRATKQDWELTAKYDYFFDEQLYGILVYGAAQEKFAGLDLRQYGGIGIGYQFPLEAPHKLSTELAILYTDEDYVNEPRRSYVAPAWSVDYERELLEGSLRFYHRHFALISAESNSKWLWHSWTGFSVPLFDSVRASAEFKIDHDSQPALRAEETDKTFRLKLGYEW